jgi:hypothetical protein
MHRFKKVLEQDGERRTRGPRTILLGDGGLLGDGPSHELVQIYLQAWGRAEARERPRDTHLNASRPPQKLPVYAATSLIVAYTLGNAGTRGQ